MAVLLCLVLFCVSVFPSQSTVSDGIPNPFEDSIPYIMEWPGSYDKVLQEEEAEDADGMEEMFVVTSQQEQYTCRYSRQVPNMPVPSKDSEEPKEDVSPEKLLSPFENICTTKNEMYWSYEFCHGKYVRQFHEDQPGTQAMEGHGGPRRAMEGHGGSHNGFLCLGKAGLTVPNAINNMAATCPDDYYTLKFKRVTEYILGYHVKNRDQASDKTDSKIRTWYYNGVNYPYYEITLTAGTRCDLTSLTRLTKVRFICYESAPFEMVYISEMTTCEYMAVIATSNLCKNPLYRVDIKPENPIQCYSRKDSPSKPLKMTVIEQEISQFKQSPEQKLPSKVTVKSKQLPQPQVDANFIRSFLTGSSCITGGQGWWKFEICYGRFIKQFHIQNSVRTDILLGTFDMKLHLLWYNKNKSKLEKTKGKGYVSHYYSNGDFCDETGKKRDVQLKIRCVSSPAISVYLQEPSTCKYILTVESGAFCKLMDDADEHGLFVVPP